IYPIAWAVVSVENKENWSWFIKCLIDDLGIDSGGSARGGRSARGGGSARGGSTSGSSVRGGKTTRGGGSVSGSQSARGGQGSRGGSQGSRGSSQGGGSQGSAQDSAHGSAHGSASVLVVSRSAEWRESERIKMIKFSKPVSPGPGLTPEDAMLVE
ncbi:hypothetical protein Tco_0648927, partial [Tanacetum coccineum]